MDARAAHRRTIAVTVPPAPAERAILAPVGMGTPHGTTHDMTVEGGRIVAVLTEPRLHQSAAWIAGDGGAVALRYTVSDAASPYPEAVFGPVASRHTRAADALVDAAKATAAAADGGRAGLGALVQEAAERFVYSHPDVRFTDGLDYVPYLACGTTEGSCVDINTYLVASLRAAGYEAGYITGVFFPAEKGGNAVDGHCWVVTRCEGVVEAWDIAHHLKLGRTEIAPGLNPKPGVRFPFAHSMGHRYRVAGHEVEVKALIQPVWVEAGTIVPIDDIGLRLLPADVKAPALADA